DEVLPARAFVVEHLDRLQPAGGRFLRSPARPAARPGLRDVRRPGAVGGEHFPGGQHGGIDRGPHHRLPGRLRRGLAGGAEARRRTGEGDGASPAGPQGEGRAGEGRSRGGEEGGRRGGPPDQGESSGGSRGKGGRPGDEREGCWRRGKNEILNNEMMYESHHSGGGWRQTHRGGDRESPRVPARV